MTIWLPSILFAGFFKKAPTYPGTKIEKDIYVAVPKTFTIGPLTFEYWIEKYE